MAPAEGARRRAPVEAAGLRFRRPPPEAPASRLSSVPGPRGASRLPVSAKAGKFGNESIQQIGFNVASKGPGDKLVCCFTVWFAGDLSWTQLFVFGF